VEWFKFLTDEIDKTRPVRHAGAPARHKSSEAKEAAKGHYAWERLPIEVRGISVRRLAHRPNGGPSFRRKMPPAVELRRGKL